MDGNLLWGTYFGGTELDRGHGVAYSNGSLYLAGETNSFGLGTPGAHQPNPTLLTPASSFLEGFITKFGMDTVAYFNQPFADTSICVGDSIHIPFQVSLSFEGNNSFILQLSNSAGSFANPTNLATLNTNTSDTFHTIIPAGTQNGDGYRLRMVSSHPAQISKDNMIDIRITAYPDTPIVTTNSPVCEGSNLNLNAHSTTPGVTYHWQGPNAFSSYAPNPFITSATSVNAGNYTVQATLHGCTVQQTASVTVNPVPATPSAGSNSPVCAGAELILTASSGTPGVSYQWYGPNGYTSTLQNPKIDPVQAKDSGDYQVIALLHGCPSDTGTTHVTVTTVSSAGIYVSPNDTLCVGGAARFVVMPQNVGINPQVQWYINGNAINGATGYVFSTTNLKDGDSVYCQIKVVGVCIEDLNIYTSGIKMTILPGTTVKPKVTITSLPQNPKPDEFVTFTAVGSHGGAIPQFQWQRDGVDVPGAVNGTYSTNDLAPWEQIRCIYTSNDICANPKSDTSNVIVANFPQSVGEMNTAGFQLFPNPNKGSFILQGTFTSHLVTIEVFNTVGQSVYQRNARPIKDQVKIDIGTSLPKGEYLLKIKEEDRISQMRFLVME